MRPRSACVRNYLRMRGEYLVVGANTGCQAELPPHARRILNSRNNHNIVVVNYLRMRGEYPGTARIISTAQELPPHARRIRRVERRHGWEIGTTSACAENTIHGGEIRRLARNYLRMRGEYISPLDSTGIFGELPPHARRIPTGKSKLMTTMGTTSACAENTIIKPPRLMIIRNYLRMRGEYPVAAIVWRSTTELPPHARRIRPGS